MVQSFKERFGLDYLQPKATEQPAASQQAPSLPPGLDAVLDAVGSQMLSILRSAPNQTSTLLNLAKASSSRLEVVLPVAQYLTQKGLIERVVEDPTGDDTYRIAVPPSA